MDELNRDFKYAIEHGIINITGVLESTNEMRKQEILREHDDLIWYAEREGYWYCRLPDSTKKNGWKNVKRKKQDAIENVLCDYFKKLEKQQQENMAKENMTLEALFYEFMEHKKSKVKPGTIKRMMIDWRRFYLPHPEFIRKSFREITRIDIDDFFNSVISEHTLKDKAFNNMCGILKQTLNYAVDAEYIDKSPYRVEINKKKIIPTRKNHNQKEVFLPDEQELLLEEMERRLENNPSNTAPLAVMLDFEIGVRIGEMLAIRESNIVDGHLFIREQVVEKIDDTDINNVKCNGFEAVDYTKSECSRRKIPLTNRALDIIERIRQINKKNGFAYKDYLFVRDNCLMTPDMIDSQLSQGCKYIGIPVRTMHKIRKTYASTLYARGVKISVISRLLGHADESTTFKFYIFNLDDDDTTDSLVLDALQGNTISCKNVSENVRKREKKIISISEYKKAENPSKIKAFHS